MPKALGLVETRGLVAAIEAADAMVKAANVVLVGKERTDPALITIKVVGETAAVRSAVDAGAAAASRVGVLVSTHIIPQPDIQMTSLIPEIEDDSNRKKEIPIPVGKDEKKYFISTEEKPKKEIKPAEKRKESLNSSDTISRLRKEALGTKKEIEKKEPKTVSVIKGNLKIEEIEILNVHQLRRLARDTEGFPIQGRQISMANRNVLLDYFKNLI